MSDSPAITETDFEAQRLQQAEETIAYFKDRIRTQLVGFVDDVLDETYTNIVPYLETDAWANLRKSVLSDLCDYPNGKHKDLRQSLFEEHKDEIIADLNRDNLQEIESLKKQIDALKEMLIEERRRY
jgi:hypothetical protein